MVNLFNKLFSKSIYIRRDSFDIFRKKYLLIKILFFKIKIFQGYFSGENNKLFVVRDNQKIQVTDKYLFPGLDYSAEGNNNTIIIHEPTNFKNSAIIIQGDNNFIEIGSPKRSFIQFSVLMIKNKNNRKLIIGDNFDIRGGEFLIYGDNRSITIGDDVMCSSNVNFRTTDSHRVIDINTKEQLNKEADIKIGNHVWFSKDVIVSKGAEIPNNCIIGTRAFVNKKFTEPNCVIAGIPAKIVKRNVTWE